MCNKIRVIVDDLRKENGEEKIKFVNKVFTSAEVKAELKAAGLKVHGIVARDANGKLIDAVEGHSYKKPRVKRVVKALLKTTE